MRGKGLAMGRLTAIPQVGTSKKLTTVLSRFSMSLHAEDKGNFAEIFNIEFEVWLSVELREL